MADSGECLAPNFEFQAPFIGPLDKDRFIDALAQFRLTDAFPDLTENWHHFRADPYEAGRVWYQTRSRATHNGAETPFTGKPTDKELVLPPQVTGFPASAMPRDATGACIL